jgi:hypothetical protein
MSREVLKREIADLQRTLAENSINLRKLKFNVRETINLHAARVEILKSIAYRQGELIKILERDLEYKEAA